ncbi:MAG: glycosyltransferase [Bryobacteraceae bacterium]|nr:glycosyltransferase [Bryobacteraceae bacterium]
MILAKPVRLGLVGCGEVTLYKHLPALRRVRGIQIAAVADLDLRKASDAAKRFGVRDCYSDLESLLAGVEVDAIGVCVPPGQHLRVAAAALDAGKHVWIDKPLALTGEECSALVALANRTRALAMTGFHMRWHRLVRQARDVLRSGELGEIESIRSVWNSPRSDEGLPDWRARRESGGGALIEIGVHHFDLWRFLTGAEVRRVFAAARDGVRDDESAIVAATLDNGVLATAVLSERTSHDIEIEVCGSAGRLRVSLLRFEGLELFGAKDVPGALPVRLRRLVHLARELPAGLASMARGGEYRESYRLAWQHFVDAVASGRPPESTLVDGWRATEIALAAVESRGAGLPLDVDPAPPLAPPAEPDGVAAAMPLDSGHSPGAEPVFSVVVPTFNRPRQVAGFLESLCRLDYPRDRFEVILVDDGSDRPLDDVVAPYRPRLNVSLLVQANAGCANARQRGAELARGRYLAFTDDDCRPAPDWLSRLERLCAANPGCAVAGKTVNALDHNPFSSASQLLMTHLVEHYNREGGPTRFYPTSNIVFPRDRFQPAGGLDARWSVSGGEDRDLCYRWLSRDFQVIYSGDAVVHHYHRLTPAGFYRQHFRYGRGAFRHHYLVGSGNWLKGRYERWTFYLGVPAQPFKRVPLRRAPLQSVLLAVSQAANATGFFWEAFRTLVLRSNSDLRHRPELRKVRGPARPIPELRRP